MGGFYILPLLLAVMTSHVTSGLEGQFRGGHVHVDLGEQNVTSVTARVTVVTAWTVGGGPCGPSCSFQDIGMSTSSVRQDMEVRSHAPDTFGRYSVSWLDHSTPISVDITRTATSEGEGQVFSVDAAAGWVQEIFVFNQSLDLVNTHYNFSIDGSSWPDLKQKCDDGSGKCGYHVQSNIILGKRNDTGRHNRAPYLSYRPVYQVPAGSVTKLAVFVADPDNDFINCRWADGDELHGMELPAGVDLTPECGLTVNPSLALGFNNLDYMALPIIVEEIVVSPLGLDNGQTFHEREILSSTQVSLMVQFVEKQNIPEFIPGFFSPCGTDGAQTEALYATHIGNQQSSFLFLPVMAKPGNGSSPGTEIARFLVTSRPGLPAHLLPPHDVAGQPGVRITDLTATYTHSDAGDHFVQVVAMDTNGALSQACTLRVDIRVVDYKPVVSNPFIGTPGVSDVTCPLNGKCDFPVFIKTDPASGDAVLSVASHDLAALPEVTINSAVKTSFNGVNVTRYQIYVTGAQPGPQDICLQLKFTKNIVSQCMQIQVVTPDPCIKLEHPCTDPSRGTCQINVTNPITSFCECEVGYSGDRCEFTVNPCHQNYCGNNSVGCHYDPTVSNLPTCQCAVDFTGSRCEHAMLCFGNPCQPHGDCVPSQSSFSCHCHKGYGGPLCEEIVGSLQLVPGSPSIIPGLTEELTLNCTFTQSPDTTSTLAWLSVFYNNDTSKEEFVEIATITLNSPAVITAPTGSLGNLTVSGSIVQGDTSFLLLKLKNPHFSSGRYFRCDAEDVDAHGPLIRSSAPVMVDSQQPTMELMKAEIEALRRTRDALIAECPPTRQ